MEKTVVLKFRIGGGEMETLRVPFSMRREKVRALYAAGADFVSIRGKVCKR